VGVDGLDHVQVAAPPGCEREARRFYGELLGLRELAGALTTAGAAVAWDDRIAGRRRFFTSDPWGNRIELLAP
jgi:hypothetical protein